MLLQKFKAPSNAPAAYPSSNLSMLLAEFIHYLLARNLSIYDFASVYFKSKVERIAMLFWLLFKAFLYEFISVASEG